MIFSLNRVAKGVVNTGGLTTALCSWAHGDNILQKGKEALFSAYLKRLCCGPREVLYTFQNS